MVSGDQEQKSQKLSWAVCACGISVCGSGLPAWTMSGNFIES